MPFGRGLTIAAGALAVLGACAVRGDDVYMKNGLVYKGTVDKDNTLRQISDGLKRVVVRDSKIARVVPRDSYRRFEAFGIDQPIEVHSGVMPSAAYGIVVDPLGREGPARVPLREPVQQDGPDAAGDHLAEPADGRLPGHRRLLEGCVHRHGPGAEGRRPRHPRQGRPQGPEPAAADRQLPHGGPLVPRGEGRGRVDREGFPRREVEPGGLDPLDPGRRVAGRARRDRRDPRLAEAEGAAREVASLPGRGGRAGGPGRRPRRSSARRRTNSPPIGGSASRSGSSRRGSARPSRRSGARGSSRS